MPPHVWGMGMDNARIKVKVGEHEFEAEGPAEMVQAQFEAFKEFIANVNVAPRPATVPPKTGGQPEHSTEETVTSLDKISRVDGRVVSLTVKPESEATAAMIIMLGHKIFRENETVTASEIADGLEQSGYRFARLDRVMKPLADEGSVVQIGAKKGTRYRFTNQGLSKAQSAAKQEVGRVP